MVVNRVPATGDGVLGGREVVRAGTSWRCAPQLLRPPPLRTTLVIVMTAGWRCGAASFSRTPDAAAPAGSCVGAVRRRGSGRGSESVAGTADL